MMWKILTTNYRLLTIVCCIFLSQTIIENQLKAQDDNNSPLAGKFKLEMKQAKWNDNPVKFDTLQSMQLKKGENFIIAYQNKKVACLVQLIYKRSASKINLSLRPIVETADGKRFYGTMSKAQHEMMESKSPMKGELNETVTYDRKTMSTVQVKFTYVLY